MEGGDRCRDEEDVKTRKVETVVGRRGASRKVGDMGDMGATIGEALTSN